MKTIEKSPRLARVRPPIDGKTIDPPSLSEIFYPKEETTDEKRHRRREETLEKARSIIKANLENEFYLKDLARLMYLHPRQMQRVFSSTRSLGFAAELRGMRLEHSKKLLGKMSVSETSKRIRYKHPSHFAKAFRREYGLTPKEFQKKLRLRKGA